MGIANTFGWVKGAAGRFFGAKADTRSRKTLPESTPQPVFLDFRDSEKRLFQTFHFSGKTTRYIPDESLWRDFEAFHQAPQPLLLWLITGKAGSGKSRAALEFCEALTAGRADSSDADENAPIWKAGFLNLAGTPFSVWKDWKPEQHTLLVFDRTTRHYNDGSRLCTGWQDGEDARQRFNIAEIIKLLAAKAERGDFGLFRVRLLLLEREHRQVSRDWYGDVSVDAPLRFRDEPTPLPPVTPKGLFGIAQDIWENAGQDGPPPDATADDFLEKLCAVDNDRRPLFAMLLAAAMAEEGGADAALARDDVLKTALQTGYDNVLQLAGADAAAQALRIMALSTLTGGRLGACDLDKDHALWGSGLGHASDSEEGIFYPWPVEPELLGECFILGGIGQDNLPEETRISNDEMRALIVKAWETCSPEVAYFFECCGQDFSSDPTWIETRYLNLRLVNVDAPLYMRTAVNLVTWFGKKQLDVSRKIFDHINSVGNANLFCRERAEISANLIRIYCEAGLFDEASPVFLGMNALGDSKEVQRCRAAASVYLVGGLCKAGELVRARVMFEGTLAFENAEEFLIPKVLAVSNMINGYARAGNLGEAQELFDSLPAYGDSEAVRIQRAKTCVNLLVFYCKAGRLEEARLLHKSIQSLGNEVKIQEEYLKASKFLYFFNAAKPAESEEEKAAQPVAASA